MEKFEKFTTMKLRREELIKINLQTYVCHSRKIKVANTFYCNLFCLMLGQKKIMLQFTALYSRDQNIV